MKHHRLGLALAALLAVGCPSARRPDPCSPASFKAVDVACAVAIRESRTERELAKVSALCAELVDVQQVSCGGAP